MNHILIVDDEAEIRESLEEILREEGYSVASAGTAATRWPRRAIPCTTYFCWTSGCPTATASKF